MSKSFLGTYFGVIEGATEVVKTTLQQVGVKKSRAFNRALSIMLVSLITFIVCCINPNAISMIYAISGPAHCHDTFHHAYVVNVSDPGA
ncbi:Serine transporter family protein [Escherichia coli]|uniref:Serine transporter family protein n=1 Tax=Escherichia coli TaxID=562 RepID=A0A377CVY3_ECOLX|nr:Serine transporter family protein [Escherichia coli]